MKTLKQPQFFIPIIIIIISLGWMGYKKIGKEQPVMEQTASEENQQAPDIAEEEPSEVPANESNGQSDQTGQPKDDQVGMANPASVYCEEQGHKLEISTSADGSQFGICFFADGSQCEEWAYFRGECQPGNFLKIDDQNQADNNSQTDSDIVDKTAVNMADWRSFTHRSFHYTINFPPDWYWDGTQVDTLVISKEPIVSPDEPLSLNNLKIVSIETQVDLANVNEYNLSQVDAPKFKAVWIKGHNFQEIVGQITQSFEYR